MLKLGVTSLLLAATISVCLHALAISYTIQQPIFTVQVAALSNQQSAQELETELVEAGFPGYIVSADVEEQTLYRVRVGAYSARSTAEDIAAALQGFAGTAPVASQVDNVPAALVPFEAVELASYPYIPEITRLEVIPWADAFVVRSQGRFEDQPFEAEYTFLVDGVSARQYAAWRAAPDRSDWDEGWTERVYSYPLYPENFESASDAERNRYRDNQIAELAERFERPPEDFVSYIFAEPGRGAPFLVLAERYNLFTGERELYPALGLPREGVTPDAGPPLEWLRGTTPPEGFVEGLISARFDPYELLGTGLNPDPSQLDAGALELSGRTWQATPESGYVRLNFDDGSSWRAVVGFPLWAFGDYLVVFQDTRILVYGFATGEPE